MTFPDWLRGASLAPSAHNTQPWRFTRQADGQIAVGWAPERSLPVGDPTRRDLFLGLGAAVESALLRAGLDDSPLRFEVAPEDVTDAVGWLVPDQTVALSPGDRALAGALDRRQTARGPHLRRAVPPAVREALAAEAARHGRRLVVVSDRPSVHRLARLAGRATAVLFADEPVHAELSRWLRLDSRDPAYHRDGLTADCLELRGLELHLARATMPPARMRLLCRVGLHHLLASDTTRVARQSAAICLLVTPAWSRAALVETGRVLQRLWLHAANAGLTAHPLSALLDCSETAGATVAAFGESPTPDPSPPRWRGEIGSLPPLSIAMERGLGGGAFPAAVFRLGYSRPAARAPRLPLDELLAASPELW